MFPNIAGAWNLILIIGKVQTMFCTEKNAPASHIRTKCKSKAMFSMYIASVGVKHKPPDTNQVGGQHAL